MANQIASSPSDGVGMSWGPRLVLVLFVAARQEGQKAQEAQHTRQTSRAGPDLSQLEGSADRRWGRKPKIVALSNKKCCVLRRILMEKWGMDLNLGCNVASKYRPLEDIIDIIFRHHLIQVLQT
jgi:hypothetical protein